MSAWERGEFRQAMQRLALQPVPVVLPPPVQVQANPINPASMEDIVVEPLTPMDEQPDQNPPPQLSPR